ncbi:unnamed protein product [Owenia fusiformis]|uniref:Uncharacterized protein n=1 Tax=Owenia fusiformis TaxID=6347 RepID=A0A8J1Y9P9_OWEFU|nr:unnamed protein product [Owenia fusiformis]
MWSAVLLVILAQVASFEAARVCHGSLGCFDNFGSFLNMPLPWSPSKAGITYTLNTRRGSGHISKSSVPSTFNIRNDVKVIVHGFNSGSREPWILNMVKELLRKGDFNVITVNWSKGSSLSPLKFDQCASNTRVIGAHLTEMLRARGVPRSKVHCIGHSLGSHVCGFAGKRYKFARITGLDPAGPLFTVAQKNARLDSRDADFVDVIHSNAGNLPEFGNKLRLGDVDFWPNGGTRQPGCLQYSAREKRGNIDLAKVFGCSHMRVCELFTESINSRCKFTANKCDDYRNWRTGRCSRNCSGLRCTSMGYNADTKARGGYYLDTKGYKPYCKS